MLEKEILVQGAAEEVTRGRLGVFLASQKRPSIGVDEILDGVKQQTEHTNILQLHDARTAIRRYDTILVQVLTAMLVSLAETQRNQIVALSPRPSRAPRTFRASMSDFTIAVNKQLFSLLRLVYSTSGNVVDEGSQG